MKKPMFYSFGIYGSSDIRKVVDIVGLDLLRQLVRVANVYGIYLW